MKHISRGVVALVVACLTILSGGHALAAPKDDLGTVLTKAGVAAPTGALTVAGDTVDADGIAITIRGAKGGKAVGARKTWSDDGVTHVGQRVGEGTTQLLSVLESPSSPKRISYDFPGKELQLLPDGSVGVVDLAGEGNLVATIEKPWAKDATGKVVATRYEVKGSTLTQVVATTGQMAFPVVADPSIIGCGFPYLCVKYNRAETLNLAAKMSGGINGVIALACGAIPWTPWYAGAFKLACAGYIAANYAGISSNLNYAKSSGRCFALRFTPNGIPAGSRVLSC